MPFAAWRQETAPGGRDWRHCPARVKFVAALIVLFIGLRVDSLRAIRDGADVTGVEVGFLADGPPDHVPADRDREAGDPHPTLLRVHHQLVGKLHQVGERRVQDWDKGDKPQRDVWRERGCLTSYDELG